jgi:hypothetical protein
MVDHSVITARREQQNHVNGIVVFTEGFILQKLKTA